MRRWSARMLTYLAAGAAGMMLLGVSFLLLTNWWVHHTGRGLASYDALDDIPARDVAIVPGTGDRDGAVGTRLGGRLQAGLSLYRAHKVRAILVSGVGKRPNGGDEVSSARVWLVARGVNPADIMLDRSGLRTLDTMWHAAHVFGVKSAVVCTQPQHMDRSLFLATASGIDSVGFKAGMRDKLTDFEVRWETLKNTLAFADIYLLHRTPRDGAPPMTGLADYLASAL